MKKRMILHLRPDSYLNKLSPDIYNRGFSMFMGLLHNLIKRIIFAYQFKNRQNMETLKPTYKETYKETRVNKVNQGTYFKRNLQILLQYG